MMRSFVGSRRTIPWQSKPVPKLCACICVCVFVCACALIILVSRRDASCCCSSSKLLFLEAVARSAGCDSLAAAARTSNRLLNGAVASQAGSFLHEALGQKNQAAPQEFSDLGKLSRCAFEGLLPSLFDLDFHRCVLEGRCFDMPSRLSGLQSVVGKKSDGAVTATLSAVAALRSWGCCC